MLRLYQSLFQHVFRGGQQGEETLALFEELISITHEVGMEVSMDVNGQCLNKMGASPENLELIHDNDTVVFLKERCEYVSFKE